MHPVQEKKEDDTVSGTDLASDGSVGGDTPIAERDQPQLSNGGDPVAEDP
jgi:hypothetical protein